VYIRINKSKLDVQATDIIFLQRSSFSCPLTEYKQENSGPLSLFLSLCPSLSLCGEGLELLLEQFNHHWKTGYKQRKVENSIPSIYQEQHQQQGTFSFCSLHPFPNFLYLFFLIMHINFWAVGFLLSLERWRKLEKKSQVGMGIRAKEKR
jgi:hypothetical protein